MPGSGKLVTKRPRRVNDDGAWLLNSDEGLRIPKLGVLNARQHFRLIDNENSILGSTSEKYRVTTLSYLYSLQLDSGDAIDWHWHPTGNADERRPHMHVSFAPGAHLPCPRHTFEEVVEACIEMLGGNAACEDWRERLDTSRDLHNEHRSWASLPRDALTALGELFKDRG
ncbi:hypothetical protein MFORT_06762 [Mycolicibacterium fortuitum subsp. fortuitum DSM 46621 = ATCC 6841 = JCM 6387]|uniref:Uncharacterized protein n=1 Tax=Mycolicibacterium fortuitum subsp. fortuitum DSM 46621 = ATCC 6841 = JCM 6387 TaxID=1214102 RepID=K0V7L8_MYCFO|nr:hypothetical protein MFORT_06762 [Mycolicibacterium fortuitum subsp. fortuitum DSM 46621 = ATCC 6841 = JCM 6387]